MEEGDGRRKGRKAVEGRGTIELLIIAKKDWDLGGERRGRTV
jgi:hypothetical protein